MYIPAKLFDPIFGPNVINGMIITADFLTYAGGKPVARVGDLVIVTGKYGTSIITEVGQIVSGCASVGQNGRSGFNFTDISPMLIGPGGGPYSQDIIDFFKTKPSLEQIPIFINDIIGRIFPECDSVTNELQFLNNNSAEANSECLNNAIKTLNSAYDNLANNFNIKLAQGLCGNPPTFPTIKEDPCIVEENNSLFPSNRPVSNAVTPFSSSAPKKPSFGSSECLKNTFIDIRNAYVNYMKDNSDFFVNTEQGKISLDCIIQPLYKSLEDINLESLISEIKSFHLKEFLDESIRFLQSFNEELIEQNINNLRQSYNNLLDTIRTSFSGIIDENISLAKESILNYINKIRSIRNQVQQLQEESDLEQIISKIECSPILHRVFNSIINKAKKDLDTLTPPAPVENQTDVNSNCSELQDIVNEATDIINKAITEVNGSTNNIGCISQTLLSLNIDNIALAQFIAGGRLNPGDSIRRFSLSLNGSWRSQLQTLYKWGDFSNYIKGIFDQVKGILTNLSSTLQQFGNDFASLPGDVANQVIGILNQLESIITTTPSGLFKFNLGGIPQSLSIASLVDLGGSPNLIDIINNPLLLTFNSLSNMLNSIDSYISSLVSQVNEVINIPRKFIEDALSSVNQVIENTLSSLQSLQSCIPPIQLPKDPFSIPLNIDIEKFRLQLPFKLPDLIKLPFDFDIVISPNWPNINIPPSIPPKPIDLRFPSITLPKIPLPPSFPPTFNFSPKFPSIKFKVPQLTLPSLNPVNLNLKFPTSIIKLPQYGFKICLPLPLIIKPPRLSFNFKIPNPLAFGPYPFNIPTIQLPSFPPRVLIGLPNITIPKLNINLSAPKIQLPSLPKLNFPLNINLNIPKFKLPGLGPISTPKFQIPDIKVDFNLPNIPPAPILTAPMICSDLTEETFKNALDTLKNTFKSAGRIDLKVNNQPISFSGTPIRPTAISVKSMWVSPHFYGWIVPVPCDVWITSPC